MKVVQITRNAALKKDDDKNFRLAIEVAGSSASFNLTAAMANKVTYEPDAGFQSTLQAFMTRENGSLRLQNLIHRFDSDRRLQDINSLDRQSASSLFNPGLTFGSLELSLDVEVSKVLSCFGK